MSSENKRQLKAFLCHASGDKPPVRELYKRLTAEGVDAWLDKEKLLPGQDWRMEIPRAVRDADVVVVCLSKRSITKEGYVQKEIKFALDIAEEKPEGTIFLIPARLEECTVPDRLNRWQWVDLYDDDGFIKLLRSLKLRADAVGATVDPAPYADSQKETDHRLEQLYTEGLAAFYTEDWDKACQRFQSILSERPNHRQAAEKLEEAERQRDLARLYGQAAEAVQSADWGIAIQILETLSQKSADYKDTLQLLRDARRQKQLGELYAEAKALHAGKQWEAVVKVFEQISVIAPTYPDRDNLLPSAQREVDELKRVAELASQYGQALHEMDAGNWYEARRLLEAVHKSETGFKETERLLKRVEVEISREEEKRKQSDEINTLYEQAHGLLRSKKWRNALDKMTEIRKLDEYFPDTDGITEKAQKELAREEQEAERQNKLAALYAEAVKLLKDEKYQEALEKWQEVKAIDPRYPDRQWVQRGIKKRLGKTGTHRKIIQTQLSARKAGIGWFILLAAIGFGLARLVELNLNGMFHIDIPGGITWGVTGALQGLIAALVLGRVEREWKWKALLVFGICWAIGYSVVLWTFREGAMSLISSLAFSLAPALSVILSSLWTRQIRQWRIYILIFVGWILAWAIGLGLSNHINPILHGSSLRWVLRDVLAGGIGLWITVDLLGRQFVSDDVEAETTSMMGSSWLLLWSFLGFVILRASWEALMGWFQVEESPIFVQLILLFVLGVCFGAVVVFSLNRVISRWRWFHSLIVIAGWALGFDAAILAIQVNLDFNAVLMVVSGLSMAGAIKLAKPSLSPLKVVLLFVVWWMAKQYGSSLGNYLQSNYDTGYVWSFGDALTILLGLLATFGVYGYSSERLVKTTLISMVGFALGSLAGTALTRLMSASFTFEIYVQYGVLGFIGGVVFELPSLNPKRILVKGGVCAVALMLGGFLGTFLPSGYLSLRLIVYGAVFGIAFGLSTRRISIIVLLAILGSAMFSITYIYIARLPFTVNFEAVIRGAMIGLVIGFGYAYLTRDLEAE